MNEISEVAKQFIFETLCFFARTDQVNARQMTLTYIDRRLLTDEQIITIDTLIKENYGNNNQETPLSDDDDVVPTEESESSPLDIEM